MISLTLFFLPMNIITTSPTNTNMVYDKIIIRRKAIKIVDSVLGNNRTFDWKVTSLIIMIYDDRLK